MNLFFLSLVALLNIGQLVTPTLPAGFQEAQWDMTVEQLEAVATIRKIISTDGFNYAEHIEENPEVYIQMTPNHERIEYYFFGERLYKIFIIYDRVLTHTKFYEELIKEMQDRYGPPLKTFDENVVDLIIRHTQWQDETSILDLRKGAGFIYQVRINKAAAEKKAMAQYKKKGI